MRIRDTLLWWSRPLFLRRKRPHATVLFAGPWVGEFGWELMCWQGFVRKLSRRYGRVIVSCRTGHEPLYADFTREFVPHRIGGRPCCENIRQVEDPDELRRVLSQVPTDADVLCPKGAYPMTEQEFVRYGTARPELRHDVVFHARGRDHDPGRNWRCERWNELVQRLLDDGLSVACIGTARQTLSPTGRYADYRDSPMGTTMDVLASARLVMGPSSGPLHLATLCGAPHLVWADRRRYRRGPIIRDRYERFWNPFGTWVRVLDADGFDPSAQAVHKATRDALALLRTTESSKSASQTERTLPHG